MVYAESVTKSLTPLWCRSNIIFRFLEEPNDDF